MGNLRTAAEDDLGRALVVDDDDHFRWFVATILSRAGFATRVAASGEDALASIQADRPTLVLLTSRSLASTASSSVARYVTSSAIAADLVVSPKTVASHVQHILRKLGVHSRTEAVAFAYNSGLLEREGPRLHRSP